MIRLALAILAFIGGILLLVIISGWAAHNLTWLVLGHSHLNLAKAGATAVAVMAVALLLCAPLVRVFVRGQRTWSRNARIVAWVGAAAVLTPLTGLAAVLAWAGGSTSAAIHECEREAFPYLGCADWEQEARERNVAYRPYWEARLRTVFNEPGSLFEAFEVQMYNRHVARGWTDATNPEHVRAVDGDWGLALKAGQRGLLPDPDSLGEP